MSFWSLIKLNILFVIHQFIHAKIYHNLPPKIDSFTRYSTGHTIYNIVQARNKEKNDPRDAREIAGR